MHAPPADMAESEDPPRIVQPALDELAERAAWALALATWMRDGSQDPLLAIADDGHTPLPEAMALDTWLPATPTSDWWM